jgi:hypothetical protein
MSCIQLNNNERFVLLSALNKVQYITNTVACLVTLCRKNRHTATCAGREQSAEKNVRTKIGAKLGIPRNEKPHSS